MKCKYLEDNGNGVKWYELSGSDYGTGITFDCEVVGVTNDGEILDCDGAPYTPGVRITVAIGNALDSE